MTELGQNLFNGLVLSGIYVLVALGITLVFGLTRLINFAHGQLLVIGTFVAYTVTSHGYSVWLGILASTVVAGVLALALQRGVFRFRLDNPLIVAESGSAAPRRLLEPPRTQSNKDVYPFERFTERAMKVALNQEEAKASPHSCSGMEHVPLEVLNNPGAEIGKVRQMIESLGRNERIIVLQIIPTSRVKKVIETSFEEARRMSHNYVGSEHLLLGLVTEGGKASARTSSWISAPAWTRCGPRSSACSTTQP